MSTAIQLLSAFGGSLGFSMLFNIRKDKLFLAALGGTLSWSVYLMMGMFTEMDVVRYFAASVAFTVYAEILARIRKAPTTLFLVSAAIPLIPGGSLFTTMNYAMHSQWIEFLAQGLTTILLAMAIAAGMLVGMIMMHIVLILLPVKV